MSKKETTPTTTPATLPDDNLPAPPPPKPKPAKKAKTGVYKDDMVMTIVLKPFEPMPGKPATAAVGSAVFFRKDSAQLKALLKSGHVEKK